MRRRSRRPGIGAWGRGLVPNERNKLSHISIEVKCGAIDYVADSFFIRESVFVRSAVAGQATGNCLVSLWLRGLAETNSRCNQDRQRK